LENPKIKMQKSKTQSKTQKSFLNILDFDIWFLDLIWYVILDFDVWFLDL